MIDSEPDEKLVDPDLLARRSLWPVIGQALTRLATDGTIREGLGQAFEKGFDVPDVFVDDFKKLTYTAYKKTYDESGDYVDDGHLADDLKSVRVPRLVIFGQRRPPRLTAARGRGRLPPGVRGPRGDRPRGGSLADGRAADRDRAPADRPRRAAKRR